MTPHGRNLHPRPLHFRMNQAQAPAFNPDAPHMQRPKLRAVRGFPLQAQDQDGKAITLLGLSDARQVSDKLVATLPAAQFILPLMDGQRTLDEIITQVGRGLARPFLEQLVAQLDDAGLLFGPTFDTMAESLRRQFDSQPNLPPGSTAAFADALVGEEGKDLPEDERTRLGAQKIPEVFDQWMDQAAKLPTSRVLEAFPKALIAPHLDYGRGWMNYAAAWRCLPPNQRPARVVVLGTNHFGEATGICACDKGYQTPLGLCPVDQELLEALRARLGPQAADLAFANRYDHEREHSIELQIPWIQHCFGKDDNGEYPRVFGVLVHDPCVNNGESYDGKGLALDPFIDALRDVLAQLPGITLVISSADLSHVGPAFGDQQRLAGDEEPAKAFREKVLGHDQELLNYFRENRPEDLITAMAWQQNPTRWCSIGNMIAAHRLVRPERIEFFGYAGAMDSEGISMVTSCAMAML